MKTLAFLVATGVLLCDWSIAGRFEDSHFHAILAKRMKTYHDVYLRYNTRKEVMNQKLSRLYLPSRTFLPFRYSWQSDGAAENNANLLENLDTSKINKIKQIHASRNIGKSEIFKDDRVLARRNARGVDIGQPLGMGSDEHVQPSIVNDPTNLIRESQEMFAHIDDEQVQPSIVNDPRNLIRESPDMFTEVDDKSVQPSIVNDPQNLIRESPEMYADINDEQVQPAIVNDPRNLIRESPEMFADIVDESVQPSIVNDPQNLIRESPDMFAYIVDESVRPAIVNDPQNLIRESPEIFVDTDDESVQPSIVNDPRNLIRESPEIFADIEDKSVQPSIVNDPRNLIRESPDMFADIDDESVQPVIVNDPRNLIRESPEIFADTDDEPVQPSIVNDPRNLIRESPEMFADIDDKSVQPSIVNDPRNLIRESPDMFADIDDKSIQPAIVNDPRNLVRESPEMFAHIDDEPAQPSIVNDPRNLIRKSPEMFADIEDKSVAKSKSHYFNELKMKYEDKGKQWKETFPQAFEPGENISTNASATTVTNVNADVVWYNFLRMLEKTISHNLVKFYYEWQSYPEILSNSSREYFRRHFPPLTLRQALLNTGTTDSIMRLFWPLRHDIIKMNQRIAVYGLTGQDVKENTKTILHKILNRLHSVPVPYEENKVVLSFDNNELAEGMNRSGVLTIGQQFFKAKRHLYNKTDKAVIIGKVHAAFELINKTFPEVYQSITQLVTCIGFYRAEERGHLGGSASTLPGVVWLEPSNERGWSVAFLAEQIVHEAIHTALFLEELVHGTYVDHALLPAALAISSVRHEPRRYDKSLHAAYVSTGLTIFHARAGFHKRALFFARPLEASVRELVKVNEQKHVLTKTGEAMLHTLTDLLTVTRMAR